MIDMRKENIDGMRLYMVKEKYIECILNNLIEPNDYIVDFEFVDWKFGDTKLYDIIYHEKLQDYVNVYITSKNDVGCGCQCYNIKNNNYTDVRYCVWVSNNFIHDDKIFEFILWHELSHFDLSNLPKIEDIYRCPVQEMYCDIKSLEIISKKYTITYQDICRFKDVITNGIKTDEHKLRCECIDKFTNNEINSDVIYENIMNKLNQ